MKIIRISDYYGGMTASIPDREINNPSGIFKWIHAVAIIFIARTPGSPGTSNFKVMTA